MEKFNFQNLKLNRISQNPPSTCSRSRRAVWITSFCALDLGMVNSKPGTTFKRFILEDCEKLRWTFLGLTSVLESPRGWLCPIRKDNSYLEFWSFKSVFCNLQSAKFPTDWKPNRCVFVEQCLQINEIVTTSDKNNVLDHIPNAQRAKATPW